MPEINEKVSFYESWLATLGFEVTLHDIPGCGNTLAAVLEGDGDVSLALIGHISTVYSLGGAEKYPPRIEGNQLYGLGTSDMHGGNPLMVEALRFLLAHGFKQFRRILVIINNDEEVNGLAGHSGLGNGASPANMTTPDAHAPLSLRASTPEQHEEIDRLLYALVKSALSVPEATATLPESFKSPPPYQATTSIRRLAQLGQEVAEGLALTYDTRLKSRTSDANALVACTGIPTLASLGPIGDGEHNANTEHILLDAPLRHKFAFVSGLVALICQGVWRSDQPSIFASMILT